MEYIGVICRRPDIKGRFRDSLIWVDLCQDIALRRLVPSEAMNQGICFDSLTTVSGTIYATTSGYIPADSKFYSAVRKIHKLQLRT
jgi:hypothetical protein